MDLAALIINLAILVATAGATAIAWWKAIASDRAKDAAELAQAGAEQARDRANDARDRANDARDKANAIAQQATAALESSALAQMESARALERCNALLEESMKPEPDPWTIELHKAPEWVLTNRTGVMVPWVQIFAVGNVDRDPVSMNDSPTEDVPPGGRVPFFVIDGTVREATLTVAWFDPLTNTQKRMLKHVNFYE